MNNQITQESSWWEKNWKWLVPSIGFFIMLSMLFFYSGIGGHMADFAKVYADKELYEKAIAQAQLNNKVTELLGELQPIDKLAILEGEVEYTDDNTSVNLSFRIAGSKRKASMDIFATKVNGQWEYKKINVRIKKPMALKQTIKIIEQ